VGVCVEKEGECLSECAHSRVCVCCSDDRQWVGVCVCGEREREGECLSECAHSRVCVCSSDDLQWVKVFVYVWRDRGRAFE